MVKMNGSLDLNETHVGCVEHIWFIQIGWFVAQNSVSYFEY
jgi:hypothetical protein